MFSVETSPIRFWINYSKVCLYSIVPRWYFYNIDPCWSEKSSQGSNSRENKNGKKLHWIFAEGRSICFLILIDSFLITIQRKTFFSKEIKNNSLKWMERFSAQVSDHRRPPKRPDETLCLSILKQIEAWRIFCLFLNFLEICATMQRHVGVEKVSFFCFLSLKKF
jgi:hypothetical protein